MTPRPLLHLEGAAVLVLSLLAYHGMHQSWRLFAVLFLAPDVSMLGYLAGSLVGSIAYNAVHTYIGPLALAGYGWSTGHTGVVAVALIWTAHIGMDRMLGYGLKYPTRFKDTHLSGERHGLAGV